MQLATSLYEIHQLSRPFQINQVNNTHNCLQNVLNWKRGDKGKPLPRFLSNSANVTMSSRKNPTETIVCSYVITTILALK